MRRYTQTYTQTPKIKKGFQAINLKPLVLLVRPERFELPTPWFVAKYSIQMSYGRLRGPNYTEDIGEDKTEAAPARPRYGDRALLLLRRANPLGQFPHLFRGSFARPLVLEYQPEQGAIDNDQGDFDVQDRRYQLPLGVVGKDKVEAFEGGQGGFGDCSEELEGRKQEHQNQIDRHQPQHDSLFAITPGTRELPQRRIAQQQQGDKGIDQDHDDFERKEVRIHRAILMGTEREVEAVKGRNAAALQLNVIVGREHQKQHKVGDCDDQRDSLCIIHGASTAGSNGPFLHTLQINIG